MKKHFLLTSLVCATLTAQAQFRVLPQGNILGGKMVFKSGIGYEPVVPLNALSDDTGIITQDTLYNRDAALHLFSPITGGKAFMAFGVNGVTVGEDSGKLNMCGRKGLVFSTLSGTALTSTSAGYFKFYHDVETTGVFITSDQNAKTDISALDASRCDDLALLNPISFRYHTQESQSAGDGSVTIQNGEEPLRFGLLAQEVQEVFPELVHEDENGLLSVDYIGLIPLMLSKINSLQQQLDAATAEAIPARQSTAGINRIGTGIQLKLYQNDPNPFRTSTEIACDVPESVSDACIRVYDLQGKQVMVLPVRGRGHTNVTLGGESLPPGMYIYALIADGREVTSKRMILTD